MRFKCILWEPSYTEGFPGDAVVKNPPANAGDSGDPGSFLGLGQPPAVGNGNPLQYFCLENSTDNGAWWATVRGVQRVRCSWACMHSYTAGGKVNWCSHYGEQNLNCAATMENSKQFYSTKNRGTVWFCNPSSGHISRQDYNLKRYMHPGARSSTIYHSQDLEATETSTDKWLDKECGIY